jgi:hypothetical protein
MIPRKNREQKTMRWNRGIAIVAAALLYGVTIVWWVNVFVDGGPFKWFLIGNAVLVSGLSCVWFALRFMNVRPAVWLTGIFRRWWLHWLILGGLIPFVLFPLHRLFSIDERILFTLWPSNLGLMALGESWDGAFIVIPIVIAQNVGTYTGPSAVVWGLMRLLQRLRTSTPLDTTVAPQ